MHALVIHGSRRGGTAGIAEQVAEVLRDAGIATDVRPATATVDVSAYDAVLVGGGLYANRWQADARRFTKRHATVLRGRPVWLFSSGPLDDSAAAEPIPPTAQVADLVALVGARGHATFGGRLPADARGLLASAMAKEHAGDWRDTEQIRGWAQGIAADLRRAPQPT